MKNVSLTIVLLALVAAGPCTGPPSGGGALSGEGVVHQGVGPECPTTWHIATSDGRKLWPLNDPAFQVEGLRVRFSARERLDTASICMAGTMVDVVTIEKL